MKNCRDFMESIKLFKRNVQGKHYNLGEELKCGFLEVSNLMWEGVESLAEADLSELFEIYQFLVDEVCEIHRLENSETNTELFESCLNIKDLNSKLYDGKRACNIYSFNDCNYEYYIIGDLHSDTVSLRVVLDRCDFYNKVVRDGKIRLIFLGDYVDRGKAHLKMLEYILALKYIFPENIYLLRGNHDGGYIIDGKVKMCVGKHDDEKDDDYFMLYIDKLVKINKTLNPDIIGKFLEFYNSLCNIAFVNQENISIMAVHGGIPRPRKDCPKCYDYINSISDLTNVNIVDNINRTIVHNMMWSDPYVDGEDLREDSGRFRFTLEHYEEFRDLIGIDLLIRGHEAENDGFKKHFQDKLITIFSSGKIISNKENINDETAYDFVNPKMIKIEKGEILFLDLVI